MKAVVYLSYDGMTDPLGQSQVLPYLSGLSQAGYRVFLISAEKTDAFKSGQTRIQAICDSANINWQPFRYTKKPPVWSTWADMQTMYKMGLRLLEKEPIGLIHCRSYIAALVGLRLKKETGIPLLFDMRGFWVDERVEGKIWNLSNPLYRLIYSYFKKEEKRLLLHSDAIVSLTNRAIPVIQQLAPGLSSEVISVIPCCTDTRFFKPDSMQNTGSGRGLKMVYLGSMSTWYMPEAMMKTFSRLLLIAPESTFTLLTREDPSLIEPYRKKYAIDPSKLFVQAAERSQLPGLLNEFDFSVCYIPPSFSKQASSPVKIGELLSMGIPVICNAGVGDLDEVFGPGKNGVLLPDFSNASLDQAIHQIKTMKKNNSQEIRLNALKIYSLDEGIRRYETIYRRFLSDDTTHSA